MMSEIELLFGVEPFYVLTYLVASTIAGAGVFYKFMKYIKRIDDRGQNQNKAFLVMAEHMDTDSERLHPDRTPRKILPTIETILKEKTN